VARTEDRVEGNAAGDWFVDHSCIDCGACRWIAPESFDYRAGRSRVFHQPETAQASHRAALALVSCPTSSIGGAPKDQVKAAAAAFPRSVDAEVHHLGFHDESSFGAASWLIVRPGGNVMIDVPRFNGPLRDRIVALGGVATLFLTHRDDIGDHAEWAEALGARRVMHRADVTKETRDVEEQIDAEHRLADDLTIIPTPGHTRGSACLLYRDRYLFSGDHLAVSDDGQALIAFDGACWFSWDVQLQSLAKLVDRPFEWVLPGHGAPGHFPRAIMREKLLALSAL
jgi:glyoxylase-like metal-dependent hydrolase (beta-lactamase superfamily II)/ferredoxin